MAVKFVGEMMNPVNPGEPHLPCVIAVDTSGSMSYAPDEQGVPIDELNDGLKAFVQELEKDSQALGRVEVCIISFNSDVNVTVPFTPAEEFTAPRFEASGSTAMNEAIITALDINEDRKAEYKRRGIKYYRPWFFLMTDGGATDTGRRNEAVSRLNDYKARKKINFFPMGIGGNADFDGLKEYADGGIVLKATATNFKEAFVWLSASLSVVSNSNPGDSLKTADLSRSIDILA